MRRMRQHVASVCGAYASKLLVQMAHTLAKSCKKEFLQAYAAHAVANCQRMWNLRQHFASVCGACGSNLLAQTAHTLANCQHMRRIRQHFASVDGACGSQNKRVYSENAYQRRRRMRQHFASECGCKLLTQMAHTVAIWQRMRRMRQQIASVDGAYGSNQQFASACSSKLLAQTACQRTRRMRQQNRVKLCVLLAQMAHAVALCQRMRQHFASVDGAYGSNLLQRRRRMRQLKQNGQYLTHLYQMKIFISALKSPTYIDFMIKKSLKSKTSKSHTWAPLSALQPGSYGKQLDSQIQKKSSIRQYTTFLEPTSFELCLPTTFTENFILLPARPR